jgi:polar amino acid transport system substrate-binding protein
MAGLTVNEKRKESVNFTNSYYDAAQVVITLAEDASFDGCITAEDVLAVLAANK